MKTLKHLALCLVATLIATGCNQEDNEPQTTIKKGVPAEFTMTINGGASTRTVTNDAGNERTITWRVGDAVGIFAVSNDGTQSNCKYTYNGEEWKTDISNAITLEKGNEYSFYAYYPYTADIKAAATANLNVLPNQSITEGEGNSNYDLSDVLISKVDASTYDGGSIKLDYTHAYAMVEVLVAGSMIGETAPQKVVLKNVVTDASIDLTKQEITNTTNKQDVIMSYVENAEYPNTYLYRAIVPAQTIASGSTLLEVYGVNGGKNYTFKAPEDKNVEYLQGLYFRMEVTIGDNNIGIKFPAGSIKPWTSTPGIDLEGEEIVIQLIKEPTLAINTILTYNDGKTAKEEGWYQASTKADYEKLAECTVIASTSKTEWSKAVQLHYKNNGESNGYYKAAINYIGLPEENSNTNIYLLKFKIRVKDITAAVITARDATNNNSFFCATNTNAIQKYRNSYKEGTISSSNTAANTVTFNTVTDKENEWTECEAYIDLSLKANGSPGSIKDQATVSEGDAADRSKIDIRIYTANIKTEHYIYVSDVTLTPYTLVTE